jgi:hypothetical protein
VLALTGQYRNPPDFWGGERLSPPFFIIPGRSIRYLFRGSYLHLIYNN